MKFKHVIVATDLQENSGLAAQWAVQMAARVGAEVTALHVIESGIMAWLKSDMDIFDNPEKLQEVEDKVQEWFAKAAFEAPKNVVVRAGSVLAQINALVEELGEETLIVFSRSNKGGIEKFFLGSTVQQVASNPPAPLAIVHPEHVKVDTKHTVVAATDFSDNAHRAVQFAVELCDAVDAKLHLVHAVAIPESNAISSVISGDEDGIGIDIKTRVQQMATTRLHKFVSDDIDTGDTEFDAKLVFDKAAADAIIDTANEEDADLIVVGHGGESPLVQNVIGSVTQGVLRNAGTTVVVVPSE